MTMKLEMDGQIKTIKEWAKAKGFPRAVLARRISRGLTLQQALQAPYKPRRRDELTGRKYGSLTVQARLGPARWLCKCACGVELEVLQNLLVTEKKSHCGCQTRFRFLIKGERLTIKEIAEKYKLKFSTVKSRIHKGWEDEDIIMPVKPGYLKKENGNA